MKDGDKSERWRDSYRRVRKDPLSDSQSTNQARLTLLGVDRLSREARLLDVGSGDGNLHETLRAAGFRNVWSIEYQHELVMNQKFPQRTVVASATDIPYATASMSAAIVMDVLHHLTLEELCRCLDEIARVVQPGGLLFVCEPARTMTRALLNVLLFSPIGQLSGFTRCKRAMVEAERATLDPWLAKEHAFPLSLRERGFGEEFFSRGWLHHFGRFRTPLRASARSV